MKDCRNEYTRDLIQKMYNILVLSMSSNFKYTALSLTLPGTDLAHDLRECSGLLLGQ